MSDTIVEVRAARLPGWPGWIADHHWLLVLRGFDGSHYESCDRWEVWQHPNRNDSCWGHLHKNLLAPCQGVGNGPSQSVRQWTGEDALAMIETIEASPKAYPFNERYRYWPGPNSNTFAQWIIGDKMNLGVRAVGGRYSVPKLARNQNV